MTIIYGYMQPFGNDVFNQDPNIDGDCWSEPGWYRMSMDGQMFRATGGNGGYEWEKVDIPLIFNNNGKISRAKTYMRTATTDANGEVSVTFPTGFFANKPYVTVTVEHSTGAVAYSVNALTSSSVSVKVTKAATLSVGLLGITLINIGAGVTVHIRAEGN